jgi:hypothetical protein
MTNTRGLLASAILALVPVLATSAQARDNNEIFGFQCECWCATGNLFTSNYYYDLGLGCGALNNRTCNVENPQTGLIETGRTTSCAPAREPADIGGVQPGGILDPGSSTGPGVANPLPGVFNR